MGIKYDPILGRLRQSDESENAGSGNDLGYFIDETALTTAYPTADDGNFAIVGSTDTIWIWDSGTVAWIDSGNSVSLPYKQIVAAGDESTELTLGVKVKFRQLGAINLTSVRANVNTAPANGSITIDILVNGSSILSTPITIEDGETTSLSATTQPVISTPAIADDDIVSVEILSFNGASYAGDGLKVGFEGSYT